MSIKTFLIRQNDSIQQLPNEIKIFELSKREIQKLSQKCSMETLCILMTRSVILTATFSLMCIEDAAEKIRHLCKNM